MNKFRTIVGSTICVISFFGLLWCAFQHGKICSSQPVFDLATHHTLSYNCKGQYPFVTPFQYAVRYRIAPLLELTLILGIFISRWGSED
jgi:hypothetical protein